MWAVIQKTRHCLCLIKGYNWVGDTRHVTPIVVIHCKMW